MKLLVHIAATVSNEESESATTSNGISKTKTVPNEQCKTDDKMTLLWLIRKVRSAVNKEIVHSPTSNQIVSTGNLIPFSYNVLKILYAVIFYFVLYS